jgi:two-component system response regulator AtoC
MAKILIVDDDEVDRVKESSILQAAGHETLFAPHGQAALKMWEKQKIDLIITDLAMPELNGLRLIQAIREEDPSARIIAISGVAPEQLDMAEDFGAMRTLFKPVDPEEFTRVVEEVLNASTYQEPDPWRSR